MTEEYNPEEALSEYGYSKKSGKGKTITIVLLSILFVASAIGAVVLGKFWSEEQAKTLTLQQQVKVFNERLSDLENKNSELSSLLADKQSEMERMREEWSTQVATLETQHKDQLQRTYGQMNEIVYDTRKTLEYIGDIETRLRKGQNLDREQAQKLSNVVNGLAFLHEQYKKPLNEFRELDRYFNEQLAQLPAAQVDPKETASFGKKLFKGKQLKAERDQYLQNQGKRTAIVQARAAVNSAYSRAQGQMAKIAMNNNQYLAQLDAIVESNETNAAEIESFFNTSLEIL